MLRRSLSSHTTKRTQWDFNPKNKLLKALMSLAQVLQLTGGPKRDVRQSPQPQPEHAALAVEVPTSAELLRHPEPAHIIFASRLPNTVCPLDYAHNPLCII